MGSDAPGFGELLRAYRLAAALSQEDLAERAGLSARGVSGLERGARRAPRLETVRLLANALGLDPSSRGALLAAARRPTTAGDANVPSPAVDAGHPVRPYPPLPVPSRGRSTWRRDGARCTKPCPRSESLGCLATTESFGIAYLVSSFSAGSKAVSGEDASWG